MHKDIEKLMTEHQLDAIIALGSSSDPAFMYFMRGIQIRDSLVFYRPGQKGTILTWAMEKMDAAASGMQVQVFDHEIYQEALAASDDRNQALLQLYLYHLRGLGLSGRVSFFGQYDINLGYHLITGIKQAFPDVEVVTDKGKQLISQSRATKDKCEIMKMAEVAEGSSNVLTQTKSFIREHCVRDGAFIQENGAHLTIGDVKKFIIRQLQACNLEAPEGMLIGEGQNLLSQPNREEEKQIRLGVPYVINLYPRGLHGYFHDVSRTWCFGYAVKQVKILYEDILGCLQYLKSACHDGMTSRELNDLAIKFYQKRGHKPITGMSCYGRGFLYALGHGVGLEIIEEPNFSSCTQTVLQKGHVMAFEPGLFYPNEGFGVRLGDTVYIDKDGTTKTMTNMSYELIVSLD